MRVLGWGSFGKILLAARKSPNRFQFQEKLYAIKVMNRQDIVLHDYFDSVKTEKDILTRVNG
jgi:serine/threonine protein kinase